MLLDGTLLKVGDLVRVFEPRACGGVPQGAIGLVVENKTTDRYWPGSHDAWTVIWLSGNEVIPVIPMRESVTYGHGLEVISESR
jgi:hypothetical protein